MSSLSLEVPWMGLERLVLSEVGSGQSKGCSRPHEGGLRQKQGKQREATS